jgi:hypothetical protein
MHSKCMISFLKSIVVSIQLGFVCSIRLCIVINIKVNHREHNLFVQLQFFGLFMILSFNHLVFSILLYYFIE